MSKEQEHKYFNCQVMFYTIDYKYKVMHVMLEAEKSYKD